MVEISTTVLRMVCGAAAVSVLAAGGLFLYNRAGTDSVVPRAVPANSQDTAPDVSCDLPSLERLGVEQVESGLRVATRLEATCADGHIVATDALRVDVSNGADSIAAGYFDLSSTPISIPANGSVEVAFVFPADMYWQLPTSMLPSSSVTLSDHGRAAPQGAASFDSPAEVHATQTTRPLGGTTEEVSEAALRTIAEDDRVHVGLEIGDRWAPQIGSKQLGLVAEGRTWTAAEILREHLELRQSYPDRVKLLWSGDWSTFDDSEWWVTVVAAPQSTAAGATAWCDREGFAPDDCLAKIVSTTLPVEGTTVLRN